MWVIKIGGSVSLSPNLQPWLDWVAEHGDGKVIIVPGGGLYADAVRAFQQQRTQSGLSSLSEHAAHALAIYAMDQMAMSFVDLQPKLTLVKNPLEIAERSWQHRGMVWLPSEMLLKGMVSTDVAKVTLDSLPSNSLPASWDVTSDSLSAWLAQVLEAQQLVLVKSSTLVTHLEHTDSETVTALMRQDVLDPYFAKATEGRYFNIQVIHHNQLASFSTSFNAVND